MTKKPIGSRLFHLLLICGGMFVLPNSRAMPEEVDSQRTKPVAEPTAQIILDWLPVNTETLMVAKGPYKLRWVDPDADDRNPHPLAEYLESGSYGSLSSVRKAEYLRILDGQEIAVAVHGARNFRDPKSLGGCLYEGCDCLVFRQGLGATGHSLAKALAAKAVKQEKIAGTEVFLFHEKLERDTWTFLIAQPRPNVLLCATDRGYLTEVLQRMDAKKGPRAFPAELPEWKHVDPAARFWAIRHFERIQDGDESPEKAENYTAASGLVFVFNPSQKQGDKAAPRVTHLSSTKRDLTDVIAKRWTYVGEPPRWKPAVIRRAPGVFEITMELTDKQASQFLLLLINHLGHCIVV